MVILNRCVRFHSDDDHDRLIKRRAETRAPSDASTAFSALLDAGATEPMVQQFLERNPSLLPGLWDLHNGPLHDIVVAKLPLSVDFVTDFAFVSRHSMALQFTLVEIESPEKTIFNKDGSFSQPFNHAHQQLADWLTWAERNINALVEICGSMFETYDGLHDHKTVRGYLVYGRRMEAEADQLRKRRWESVQVASDKRLSVMTYDRLLQARHLPDTDLIVCTYQNRGFYAKSEVL